MSYNMPRGECGYDLMRSLCDLFSLYSTTNVTEEKKSFINHFVLPLINIIGLQISFYVLVARHCEHVQVS